MAIRSKPPGQKPQSDEYWRLIRKGDQESELGSLANQDGDGEAAAKHYAKAREYWGLAKEYKN